MSKQKPAKAIAVICAASALIISVPVLLLALVTLCEYKPAATEPLETGNGSDSVARGTEISLASWNTGYGGLSAEADFFMDGGKGVNPESQDKVRQNVAAMAGELARWNADVVLLQEVDLRSTRTAYFDQTAEYAAKLGRSGAFAYNFKCLWVPYPLPMIGHVESGVYTSSRFSMSSAERVSLPSPFAWPVSTCNLKRCLLVSRFPVEGTDKELTVINLHLEAYDSGEGKAAQTKALSDMLKSIYESGGYVIAGGDFNQAFPGGLAAYPIHDAEGWAPGELTEAGLPEGFSFAADASAPSCRSLISPYGGGAGHQFYLIDGFIVSDNIEVLSVETRDLGFEVSDHNPVLLSVRLK